MDSKLVATATLVVVACFGGGVVLGKRASRGDAFEPGSDAAGGSRPAAVVSALGSRKATSGRSATSLSKLAQSGDHGWFTKFRGYMQLISDAGPEEMGALIAALARDVPADLGGDELIEIAARRWAEKDPHGALDALLNNSPPAIGRGEFEILKVLAERDPMYAWRKLAGLGEDGNVVVGGAITSAQFRERAMGSLLQGMAKHHPEMVREVVLKMPNLGLHEDAIIRGLEGLAAEDPVMAILTGSSLPPTFALGKSVYGEAFENLAAENPYEAAANLELIPQAHRSSAVLGVVRGMVGEDPAAAWEWASALPAAAPNTNAIVHAFEALAGEDPEAALVAYGDMSSLQLRQRLAGSMAEARIEEDPQAALAWAWDDLEGSAQRSAFDRFLLDGGSQFDLDTQQEIAAALPGYGKGKKVFAGRWAEQDPAAAAVWAIRQREGADQLFGAVAEQWHDADRDGFEEFVNTLPEGGIRSQGEGLLRRQQ